MPCIFLKDGKCNNPNRNRDFECGYMMPSKCTDGINSHYSDGAQKIGGNTEMLAFVKKYFEEVGI